MAHAAFFEEIVDVAQRTAIVGEVLQDVEEDYGVKRWLGGKRAGVGGVQRCDVQVGPVRAQPFEGAKIFGIDVCGPIDRARHQVQRQIADARSDFQHAVSDIWPDHVRHPARETRGAVQAQQNFSAMSVGGVDLVGSRDSGK